jgi:hypothetical protein
VAYAVRQAGKVQLCLFQYYHDGISTINNIILSTTYKMERGCPQGSLFLNRMKSAFIVFAKPRPGSPDPQMAEH